MIDGKAERWQGLSDRVREEMAKRVVPGVSLAVLHYGEIQVQGFGVTSVENPLEVTPQTLFQIGSITKTFTTTALMRLVEGGKLELDRPVRAYLPGFRVANEAVSSAVTLRHLLTHTGGWEGDLFVDTGSGEDALRRYVAEMAAQAQVSPLGAHFSYNNSGFTLVGSIVEEVTGKSYVAALRELVLQPIGLEQVFFNPADIMTRRFAVGHSENEGKAVVASPWALPRYVWPAGGIITTAGELLRYARFHLGDGRDQGGAGLLATTTMDLMRSPQVRIYGEEAMGLSWFIEDRGGVRLLSHAGGTRGQASFLMLAPQKQFAVAILTNAGAGMALATAVADHALREYCGLDKAAPKPIDASPAELAEYVGLYSRPYCEIEIGMLCGRLVAQLVFKAGFPTREAPPNPPPPPATVAPCGKDRLLVLDGPIRDSTADVVRRPDGSIGWLRMGRRLCARR